MKVSNIRWVSLVAFAALALPLTGSAATIAYWQFEPGNFTADSSGNGHTLTNIGGVTTDGPASGAPGAGSAQFDGVNDYLRTLSTLNLSSYSQLTIEWFMKNTGDGTEYAWGHGETAGGMRAYLNANLAGGSNKIEPLQDLTGGGIVYRSAGIPGGIAGNQWHHYAFQIDATDPSATGLKLFIDGVETGTFNSFGTLTPTSFLNTQFHIGVRSGLFGFMTGNIDELRISSGFLPPGDFVPEPSVAALLGLGGLLLWRRRR